VIVAYGIIPHTLEWEVVIIKRGKDVMAKARRAIYMIAINLDRL